MTVITTVSRTVERNISVGSVVFLTPSELLQGIEEGVAVIEHIYPDYKSVSGTVDEELATVHMESSAELLEGVDESGVADDMRNDHWVAYTMRGKDNGGERNILPITQFLEHTTNWY